MAKKKTLDQAYWEAFEKLENDDVEPTHQVRAAEEELAKIRARYAPLEKEYHDLLQDGNDEAAKDKHAELRLLEDKIKFAEREVRRLENRRNQDMEAEVIKVAKAAEKAIRNNTDTLEKLQEDALDAKAAYEKALRELQEETEKFCSIRRTAGHLCRRRRVRKGFELTRVPRYTPDLYKVEPPPIMEDLTPHI